MRPWERWWHRRHIHREWSDRPYTPGLRWADRILILPAHFFAWATQSRRWYPGKTTAPLEQAGLSHIQEDN